MVAGHEEFEVAIVGFGPVGALLANLLGQRGIRTVVIEREREVYRLPRAVHFDHEVMRIFQSVGLSEAVARDTAPITGYEFLNADRELLFCFDLAQQVTSQGWQPDYMFHQPGLEATLRDAATKCESVDVLLECEGVALEEGLEAVGLEVRDRHTGKTRTLRAAYVVGCDGANSFVRKQVGLELEDLEFDEPWLVVDAKTNLPPDERGLPIHCTQLCDPARPVTFIPVVGPYIRWEFMLRPEEDKAEMLDPARVDALIREWIDPAEIELVRTAVYDFHALVARRWNTTRVFLAGDAAHQTPPFLGQGMCAGMRDAANLAWKLDWVVRGRASPALLDSYSRERDPHVRHVIGVAIQLGRVICTIDAEAARARDANWLAREQRTLESPPLPGFTDGFLWPGAPLAGQPGLQARVREGARDGILLDDATGPGLVLLRRKETILGQWERSALSDLGGRDFVIDARTDPEGAYANWLEQHGCDAVLVRPDHQVFGGAAGPDAPAALLEALRSQLG